MEKLLLKALLVLPSSLCVIGAVYVAVKGVEYWPWFLVAAIAIAYYLARGEDER